MLGHVTVPMMLMMRSDGSTSATSSLTRTGQLPHLAANVSHYEGYPTTGTMMAAAAAVAPPPATGPSSTYTVDSLSSKGVIVSPGRHNSHRHHLHHLHHHHHHPLATVSVIEEELSTVSTPLMSSSASSRVINPRESAVWSYTILILPDSKRARTILPLLSQMQKTRLHPTFKTKQN